MLLWFMTSSLRTDEGKFSLLPRLSLAIPAPLPRCAPAAESRCASIAKPGSCAWTFRVETLLRRDRSPPIAHHELLNLLVAVAGSSDEREPTCDLEMSEPGAASIGRQTCTAG